MRPTSGLGATPKATVGGMRVSGCHTCSRLPDSGLELRTSTGHHCVQQPSLWVCPVFPQDGLRWMPFWQGYHRGDTVFKGLPPGRMDGGVLSVTLSTGASPGCSTAK